MKKDLFLLILAGLLLLTGAVAWAQDIAPPEGSQAKDLPIINTFKDIQGHWAEKDIVEMYNLGILQDVEGITPEKFGPKEIVTGKELISSLENLFERKLGKENNKTGELISIFEDPDKPAVRMNAARAIEQAFIINELSVITTEIFPIYDDTANLAPEETSALSFVFNAGIMKGRAPKIFAPNEPITRAELASILSRTSIVLELAEPIEEINTEDSQ
ncbi:MAG: S-layer homology domain-containing protein [Clostridia bacterium]|nr:S-layer homology domain-containing protein [Clostridia bacterium]